MASWGPDLALPERVVTCKGLVRAFRDRVPVRPGRDMGGGTKGNLGNGIH